MYFLESPFEALAFDAEKLGQSAYTVIIVIITRILQKNYRKKFILARLSQLLYNDPKATEVCTFRIIRINISIL